MLNVAIVGASGYTGAVLCDLLLKHPKVCLKRLFVSQGSKDQGKSIASLHGFLQNKTELVLEPLPVLNGMHGLDAIFLCTDHKVSHDLALGFIKNGIKVFDLSGAFRVNDQGFYEKYYGFTHEYPELLKEAVYALCEWCDLKALQNTSLVSLPGCYPTVSQLSLLPLLQHDLIDRAFCPVINAVSGVTGAGRSLKLSSHFCEVSLNAYGLFTHRHQPEISRHLGTEVIFNPHLGNFKRGILATITAKLKDNVSIYQIHESLVEAYQNKPFVRLKKDPSKIMDVEKSPYCDIFANCNEHYVVLSSAIDNLMKGASSQAVQAFNLAFNFDETTGLI